jgi:hypothetical protein
MKLKQLLDKLNIAKTCLATQDTIPVLTHFYFDNNKIMSFNSGQAAILDFENNLSGCILGDQLVSLLNSYTAEEISLSQGKTTVALKSGRSVVNLKTLPIEDFPFQLADDLLNTGVVYDLTEEFFDGLKACALSMGRNAGQRNQYGITVISTPEKTVLYSSDNARISSFTLSKPIDSAPFTILLPKPFCDNLITVSRTFKNGKLYVGKDFVLVDFSAGVSSVDGKPAGLQLYSKFNDAIDFLPFENIFAQVEISDDKFQPIPESLIKCVDRSLILIGSDKDPEMFMKTEGKIMTITSRNAHGDIVDEVEFLNDLDSIDCKMKPLFIRQALTVSEKITFSAFETDSILIGVKKNFLHLVSSIAN